MLRVLLVLPVLPVHKEYPGRLALKDQQVLRALPDLKDRKEIRGLV